jgi:hypothetical protein
MRLPEEAMLHAHAFCILIAYIAGFTAGIAAVDGRSRRLQVKRLRRLHERLRALRRMGRNGTLTIAVPAEPKPVRRAAGHLANLRALPLRGK